MNRFPLVFRLLLLAALLLPVAWAQGGFKWTAERSRLMRQQVRDLLGARRAPTPLPNDPPNPFSAGAGGTAVVSGPSPSITPVDVRDGSDSAAVLARAASRLRIGGIIRMRDYVQIVINDTPWREGESILVEREPRPIRLQIVRIQPGQLTLRLDEAEMTLRF